MKTRAIGKTDIGLSRHKNEDDFLIISSINIHDRDAITYPGDHDEGHPQDTTPVNSPNACNSTDDGLDSETLLVVADGLGGEAGGEIASKLVVETCKKCFLEKKTENPASFLEQMFIDCDRNIRITADNQPSLAGMGTVATAALFRRNKVYIGHIGDTRLYVSRKNMLQQLTEDHTMVADMVKSGEIPEEIAGIHPLRNVVSRALGTGSASKPAISVSKVFPGDIFVLCSDGLYGMVPHILIQKILSEFPTPEEALEELVEMANARGGKDNITVILAAIA